MIVHVGSLNPTKIAGVKNVFGRSAQFEGATVVGVDANVEEFGHPKTLDETIQGAKNRAKAVFDGSDMSIGLESGLFPTPHTKSGYLETTVCAIYDGKKFHIGCGPSFEWPKKMTDLILSGLDGSQAFRELGLTDHQKIGEAEGAIYPLTKGKLTRTDLNELAVTTALIHLENSELYE